MAETIVINEEMVEEKGTIKTVTEVAHKALQAGIGAVALAQDEFTKRMKETREEVSGRFDKMVERGAKVEEDSRKRVNEMVESRRKQVDETVSETQSNLDKRIEKVLHSMNVPTKSDIDALNKKVTSLTRKVNALAKEAKA